MALTPKPLDQVRPSAATNTSAYSPAANKIALISQLIICNTSAAATTFRVFMDIDGTTFDVDSALAYDVPIAGNETIDLVGLLSQGPWTMNENANLAVYATLATLTFTTLGTEKDV